jgi:hypothetical protein
MPAITKGASRMQIPPQTGTAIDKGYSASGSSDPAGSAFFDVPDATPRTGHRLPLIAAWIFGALVLAGLVTFVVHFGALKVLIATVRDASPVWLAAGVCCQVATYAYAAAVWFRVLKRAGSSLPFLSLLRLALVELFANQAIPPGVSAAASW